MGRAVLGGGWIRFLFGSLRTVAAPVTGEVFELRQPDGSLVHARILGDWSAVETLRERLEIPSFDSQDVLRTGFAYSP